MHVELMKQLAHKYHRELAFICVPGLFDVEITPSGKRGSISFQFLFDFARRHLGSGQTKNWEPDLIAIFFSHTYDIDEVNCSVIIS